MRSCLAVESELAELRAAFDQYFLGVERMPPTKRHDALKRQMRDLKGQFIRQTSVRFRIDNLAQKLTTFERLWDRTLKEIEAGTYKRHLFKAKLHQKAAKKPAETAHSNAEPDFDVDEDLDVSDLGPEELTAPNLESALAAAVSATKQAASFVRPSATMPGAQAAAATPAAKPPGPGYPAYPAKPAAAPPAVPRPVTAAAASGAGAPGGLSDQKIKAIYDAYVMAKKRCGEDTSKLSLNAVADTLKKQVPALMKQHQAKSVEFKVVIKDGKAVLRALPKE